MDYTMRESGLQLDQPPAIGNISSVTVLVLQNDNVEGILGFSQDFVNITGKRRSCCFIILSLDEMPNKHTHTHKENTLASHYFAIFQLQRRWARC